ncbi:hypothetical protein RJT34_30635 [Clitoria ternatea]|uniref:Uncharacterized protein n=1 Tax=Clitoria ternatea TaxID=43366 RepID=A0AAN9I7J9_CLITE
MRLRSYSFTPSAYNLDENSLSGESYIIFEVLKHALRCDKLKKEIWCFECKRILDNSEVSLVVYLSLSSKAVGRFDFPEDHEANHQQRDKPAKDKKKRKNKVKGKGKKERKTRGGSDHSKARLIKDNVIAPSLDLVLESNEDQPSLEL